MSEYTPDLLISLSAGAVACIGVCLVLYEVFWLWMLAECLVKEPSDTNDKVIWGLIIFFVPVGHVVYFFFRRPHRILAVGE